MNFRLISYILGVLVLVEAGLFALCAGVSLLYEDYNLETVFRKALFQVATTHTSCGFAADDYNLWPQFTWMLLIFAMLSAVWRFLESCYWFIVDSGEIIEERGLAQADAAVAQ